MVNYCICYQPNYCLLCMVSITKLSINHCFNITNAATTRILQIITYNHHHHTLGKLVVQVAPPLTPLLAWRIKLLTILVLIKTIFYTLETIRLSTHVHSVVQYTLVLLQFQSRNMRTLMLRVLLHLIVQTICILPTMT